jgi:hypothetical protein
VGKNWTGKWEGCFGYNGDAEEEEGIKVVRHGAGGAVMSVREGKE